MTAYVTRFVMLVREAAEIAGLERTKPHSVPDERRARMDRVVQTCAAPSAPWLNQPMGGQCATAHFNTVAQMTFPGVSTWALVDLGAVKCYSGSVKMALRCDVFWAAFLVGALHAQVVINELYYNPPGSGDETEFIEFWNIGSTNVSLAGWYMQDGVTFVFPAGAQIAAGGFLVLVKDPAAFALAYPHVSNVYGPFANNTGLNNSGERVALANASGVVVSEVTYADRAPWPPEADGDGCSLELRQPRGPTTAVWNWGASRAYGGSPGATNSLYAGFPGIVDMGPDPAFPAAYQSTTLRAFALAPTSIASLVAIYATNLFSTNVVTLFDDGMHNDGTAGDAVYAGALPGVAAGTYVRYYYRMLVSDGSVFEMPAEEPIQPMLPGLTARLSGGGLYIDVVPQSAWQVISTTGQATSSRLYLYLSAPGEVQVDDVAITLGGTQHIVNGTFDTSATNWQATGNHSNSYFTADAGSSAPGCMTIVARGAGGSWDNSVNCYTSPNLINNGPLYVLSFAYRLAPTNSRSWLRYYVGSTNWHNLRLNEVMPYNSVTRADSDSEYNDWFELYNSGTVALNLAECTVSDDADNPRQWRFPDMVLAPGAHLLVWASGKNRTAGELHTNFRLAASGEALILTDPFGREVDRLTWGSLPPDVSYGCLPDGVTSRVYFASATPGTTNQPPAYAGIAETPRPSRPGGLFLGSLVLTLHVQNAQAQIHYTLDGTIPQTNATMYTAPLMLSSTTRLCARTFAPGLLPSPVARHEYYRLMPSILTSSPLPILVIDTRGQSIPDEPKIDAFLGIISNGIGRNYVTDPFSHFEGRIGIELRGQTSLNEPQKQYGFETRDDDGEDRDATLFNFPAESDWVLYAPYNDKTLMRNVLAYDAFRRMGWYASRTMYCELVLNGSYEGVYVLMEKIKRAPGRVNITKLAPVDNTPPTVSGGYIVKIDKTDSGDVVFYTDEGTRFIHVYPRGERVTSAQQAWIRSYLTNFEACLRSPTYTHPVSGYARFIDVSSFVDTYVLVQAWKNIDGLRLSSYFYKDRNGKLVSGPPWDYNISLGNANYYDGWNTSGWYTTGDYYAIPFWWARFRADTNFMALCRQRWQALRKDILHRTNFAARIDTLAAVLDEPQRRHFQRWPILGTYVWPNYYYAATSYAQEVTWMKRWAHDRMAWIDGQWNTLIADFSASPLTALLNQAVVFTNLTYGNANAFRWEFGDGAVSSVRHPLYSYSTIGLFNVTLVVSNFTAENGWSMDSLTRTNYVLVVPEAVGFFTLLLLAALCFRWRE
ncbi:MAG: CotH kinase family protein [bacterium]|nr:CotH kinase family protein [bacterium]